MKVLLITDQHFGVRNDNTSYIDRYRKYYGNVVLPFIKKEGITHVICLGDTFDRRKSINFNSLEAAKEMWFTPLEELGVTMTMLVGNHDIYFKNTLSVNAPELLLGEYSNINVVAKPNVTTIGGIDILCLPWICDDNRQEAFELIDNTTANVCMGHLELNGFEPLPGHVMDHGDDPERFKKFKLVCSGHFHLKSRRGNITYLGNPYQLYWNDYAQKRGFHVLDTETLGLKFYQNPYNTFYKVYYDDSEEFKLPQYEYSGSYVKLIVQSKNDHVLFNKTIKKLQSLGCADLKIVEDVGVEIEDQENIETEDTLTILEKCVSEMENKDEIFVILKSLYLEALEL